MAIPALYQQIGLLALLMPFGTTQAGVQTPPKDSTTTSPNAGRKIVMIDASQTLIEEKSVSPDPRLSSAQNAGMTSRFIGGDSRMNSAIKENSPGHGITEMQNELPRGATFYKFTLEPREELSLRLKCEEHGKVFMQFIMPPTMDAMTAQFRRANMAPRPSRASRIETRNITSAPYEVILAVYGDVNYAYRIEITRSK